jgi:Kdo2-lipid IVA lauroyltransferase/acyltransferase
LIRVWFLKALMVVAPRVPVGVLYALADVAGSMAWGGSGRLRGVTRDHMRHVLGSGASPREVDRAGRGCVRSAARYYVDFARYAGLEPESAFEQVDSIEGVPELFAAYDRGQGVVLASAHLGNPEFIAQALGPFFDLLVLTEPLEPRALHKLVHEVRERSGVRFVPAGVSAARESVRQLRYGGVLGVLVDRDVLGGAPTFPFFGERAPMPTGAVELAWITGAAVVVGFVTRSTAGRYRIVLREVPVPHRKDGVGDRAADVETGMRSVVSAIEGGIAEAPEQWFALSAVWSSRRLF